MAPAPFGSLLEDIEGGSPYAYGALVRHLVRRALDGDLRSREEAEWLRRQDAGTWRRVDLAARGFLIHASPFPPEPELRAALPDGSTLLAAMSSFHRSGYVR